MAINGPYRCVLLSSMIKEKPSAPLMVVDLQSPLCNQDSQLHKAALCLWNVSSLVSAVHRAM